MSRVIISSGHTQKEPGAVSGDLKEVDIAKNIASKIISHLRSKGIITLSLPPELELDERISWINKTGCTSEAGDICVEIHINEGSKNGLEGWYMEDEESKNLTESILKYTSEKCSLNNGGAKSENSHPLKSLKFLSETKPISSIIECLSIDNKEDQLFLKDEAKLEQLAEGISNGILVFYDPNYDTNIKKTTVPKANSFDDFDSPYSQNPSPAFPPVYNPTNYNNMWNLPPKTQPQKNSREMSREEKKNMIKSLYKKLLGREVSDQDLNYFINLGFTEEQMTKRIIDSQEHVDRINDAQEYTKIKDEYNKLKFDNQKLKKELQDKNAIITQLNNLVSRQNPQNSVQTNIQNQPQIIPTLPQNQNKSGIFDKFLKKINDMFD